jgi:putative MATE family efflux protein
MTDSLPPRLHLLLRAPVPGALWKLAAPNVLAVATMTGVTVADAFYVGHLGTAALASLALVFPFQTLMQMMAGGAIGGGVTSALARALGSRNQERATVVAWHGLLIGLCMAAAYMMTLGLFAREILSLIGGTGAVLDGAALYAAIAFGGAPALWLVMMLSAVLRGTGDTVTPARATVTSSLAQIALSGALTLGWGPFPQLGIAGPATAMVVCMGAAGVYLLSHLLRGKAGVRLKPARFDWSPVRGIMQVGGVGLINSMTIALTVVVVTALVARFGVEALAGYGLGSRLELMLIPIAFGVGAALTAAVGANFGASQYGRARRFAWTGAGATFVITGLLGLAVAIEPSLWLDRFTSDANAYAYGALYLGIAGPFYGVFGGGQTLYFASQGTGRMQIQVAMGFLRFLIVAAVGWLAVTVGWDVAVVFAGVAAGLAAFGIGQGLSLLTAGWRPDRAAGHRTGQTAAVRDGRA